MSWWSFENRHRQARDCFDLYQQWFASLRKTGQSLDVNLGGLRLRGFGSPATKQAAWDRDWRSKHPDWGPAAAGVTVSSSPPEIWFDLRVSASGELILPVHVLGHELAHVLRLHDSRVLDPDELVERATYEP